jgi:DNA-directed RNA polymerase subunit RPC12/RpoP
MQCKSCGFKHLLRTRRTGWFESRVLPLFGFYPWRCRQCKAKFLLKDRGKKTRKRLEAQQAGGEDLI